MDDAPVPTEMAYYYPEPYWLADEGGWVKSLLLFFDEIAILLPEYMRGRNVIADPTLAGPIEDLGLLRVIEPETFVDDATAAQLAEVIDALVESALSDARPIARPSGEVGRSRTADEPCRPMLRVDKRNPAGPLKPTPSGVLT